MSFFPPTLISVSNTDTVFSFF